MPFPSHKLGPIGLVIYFEQIQKQDGFERLIFSQTFVNDDNNKFLC